jgi:methionyl-tRNA formyltransferase
MLGVHRAALLEPQAQDGNGEPSPPGLAVRDAHLLLQCTPGVLELELVQPPGGRAMDAAAYLRGHTPFGGAP